MDDLGNITGYASQKKRFKRWRIKSFKVTNPEIKFRADLHQDENGDEQPNRPKYRHRCGTNFVTLVLIPVTVVTISIVVATGLGSAYSGFN